MGRIPAAEADSDEFGKRLVDLGLVTPAQLAEALLQQPASGKRIGNLLVDLGALDERDLAVQLAETFGFQNADLGRDQPDPAALKALPETVARANTALALRLAGGILQVAVADPLDEDMKARLRAATPYPIQLVVAAPSDILRAIESSYRALVDVDSLVSAFEATAALRNAVAVAAPSSDDAPVVQLVNRIITQGFRDRASDVHVEPQDGRVRIRFRIDGALHDVLALPQNLGPAVVSRLKILGDLKITEHRRSQDGQIAMTIDGREIDIRINICPTVWGEKAVLRLLDRRRALYRLDALGMGAENHAVFSRLVRSPFGMVICSGPTGAGKTTTLYATLAEINQTERNVMTIEDPVEYVFPSANQIQINQQAGLTFATGLRAILRQDPDVILVGEIRDAETAGIAVESALTGHMVLTSLHATDACSALHRLVDMDIEPFLIASTVVGITGQRLIRRICQHCREPYQPPIEEMAFLEKHLQGDAPPTLRFLRGQGCNFCSRTGYQDRIGVFEILTMNDDIKHLVMEGASVDDLRDSATRNGVRPLIEGALSLVQANVTTIAEVMRTLYGV